MVEMQKHIQLWDDCLQVIKDNIDEAAYNTFFATIVPLEYKDNNFVLKLPTHFHYEIIEAKYIDLLRSTLFRKVGKDTQLLYRIPVDSSRESGGMTLTDQPKVAAENAPKHNLFVNPFQVPVIADIDPNVNPNCNFNNLIEGEANRLARTAGLAIAKDPGTTAFNPLFVYGSSGVGKTHLAQATAILTKQLHPQKRVLYVSANLFQIQYTDAQRKNEINDFLNFYQSIDCLIIDDIHEFAGKKGTQKTFFHIFNHLQQSGKQIILTSDRPPIQLQEFEERLMTRFKWGLSAEMQKPDFALRKAILQFKIKNGGWEMPEDVVDFIAENVRENVRDIEGVLISLQAQSAINGKAINLELAEEVVGNIVDLVPQEISVEKIKTVVSEHFGLEKEDIMSRSRKASIASARQIAMYLSKRHTTQSLSSIGHSIGKLNHATVLYSCQKVSDMMEIDKRFRKQVTDIEEKIKR
jgi:chromosomal replication initiator protein